MISSSVLAPSPIWGAKLCRSSKTVNSFFRSGSNDRSKGLTNRSWEGNGCWRPSYKFPRDFFHRGRISADSIVHTSDKTCDHLDYRTDFTSLFHCTRPTPCCTRKKDQMPGLTSWREQRATSGVYKKNLKVAHVLSPTGRSNRSQHSSHYSILEKEKIRPRHSYFWKSTKI